jgi:CRISPR/Cas system-associated exonuclease Cas4 (RecB family)
MTAKLYKNTVEIDFDEGRHSYFLMPKKEKLLSVTGCTSVVDKSGPLVWWAVGLSRDFLLEAINEGKSISSDDIVEASNQHQIKKEAAATIGSKVHKWAEAFAKAKVDKDILPLPKDPQVLAGVNAFLKWIDANDVKFISSERIVFSKSKKFVGIMDAEAVVNGKLCVIDYKTSSNVYPEHYMQVSAYQAALSEENGKVYTGKWIIRFDKNTGEFDPHYSEDQEKDYKAFLCCLGLKRRLQEYAQQTASKRNKTSKA